MVLSPPNIAVKAAMPDKTPNPSIQSGRAGSAMLIAISQRPAADFERRPRNIGACGVHMMYISYSRAVPA